MLPWREIINAVRHLSLYARSHSGLWLAPGVAGIIPWVIFHGPLLLKGINFNPIMDK